MDENRCDTCRGHDSLQAQFNELKHKFESDRDEYRPIISNVQRDVGAVRRKFEDTTLLLTQQNVLMEKFSNMDKELTDSFNRVHKEIDKIESMQNTGGCTPLKEMAQSRGLVNERIKVGNNRITNIESNIKWVTRSIIGLVITAVIGLLVNVQGMAG